MRIFDWRMWRWLVAVVLSWVAVFLLLPYYRWPENGRDKTY
jgi:hypothetical protein